MQGNDEKDFSRAIEIYDSGGNVGPFATLRLSTTLVESLAVGTRVEGNGNADGSTVVGYVIKNHPAGSTTLQVRYEINEDPAAYVGCKVGALGSVDMAETSRCKCVRMAVRSS